VAAHQAAALTVRARQIAVAALCAGIAGCGGGPNNNPSQIRSSALDCLKNQKHLDASLAGRDAIQVGTAPIGPRIKFFLTSGEAEAYQFEGKAEGSEHIGKALLFVNRAPDSQLKQVEKCLDDLA
jgi:hypothetical protein